MELVQPAAGPAERDFIYSRMFANSEMDRQSVLGNITAPASNLVRLAALAGANLDPGSNSAAIGFDADRLYLNPTVLDSSRVFQQTSRSIHIVDRDL